MKNKRLYNVVFNDGTACSVETYTKVEARKVCEEKYKKRVTSVIKCYNLASDDPKKGKRQ